MSPTAQAAARLKRLERKSGASPLRRPKVSPTKGGSAKDERHPSK